MSQLIEAFLRPYYISMIWTFRKSLLCITPSLYSALYTMKTVAEVQAGKDKSMDSLFKGIIGKIWLHFMN